jgi:hypothetical protein
MTAGKRAGALNAVIPPFRLESLRFTDKIRV